jgi:hypothetical protein
MSKCSEASVIEAEERQNNFNKLIKTAKSISKDSL